MRGALAKKRVKKIKSGHDFVKRRVYKQILRRRWRKLVTTIVAKMKGAVSVIQRVRRRLCLHRKIILAVNRKIAFNRQERFRKEMERQAKEEEEARNTSAISQ